MSEVQDQDQQPEVEGPRQTEWVAEPEPQDGPAEPPSEGHVEQSIPQQPQPRQMVLHLEPRIVRLLRDTFIAVGDGAHVTIVEQEKPQG